jgi:hypothetical protein
MGISKQPSPTKIMIDQKQAENVEYLKYFGSMIKNHARSTREIKSRIATAKLHSRRSRGRRRISLFSPAN